MVLIDTYRNNISGKKKELSKLQSDKANELKKASDYKKKILTVRSSISRSKNESTIRTKTREIERNSTKLATINKKVATLETKIASKSKEIANEEKNYNEKKRENGEKENKLKLKD